MEPKGESGAKEPPAKVEEIKKVAEEKKESKQVEQKSEEKPKPPAEIKKEEQLEGIAQNKYNLAPKTVEDGKEEKELPPNEGNIEEEKGPPRGSGKPEDYVMPTTFEVEIHLEDNQVTRFVLLIL